MAFRTFGWGPDGVFEFGFPSSKPSREPNIGFDGQYALVLVEFNQSKLMFGLDTGGETTSLSSPFSRKFSDLVTELGKKDSKRVDVIGSDKQIDSISLPQLQLKIGGFPTVPKPAHILLDGPDQGYEYGTLGMDILKQGRRTMIDFASMTLTME